MNGQKLKVIVFFVAIACLLGKVALKSVVLENMSENSDNQVELQR